MLMLHSLLAPRLFVPSRFVFLQRIETNIEEVSTRFVHLAHPPSSYIAQVCAIATLRERLMRFKPGVPYEIRYGLIEDDVLFPDHALVVSRMAIIYYDVVNHCLQLTNSFRPSLSFTSSIHAWHPILLFIPPVYIILPGRNRSIQH